MEFNYDIGFDESQLDRDIRSILDSSQSDERNTDIQRLVSILWEKVANCHNNSEDQEVTTPTTMPPFQHCQAQSITIQPSMEIQTTATMLQNPFFQTINPFRLPSMQDPIYPSNQHSKQQVQASSQIWQANPPNNNQESE